jgi:phage-related protein
MASTVLIDDYDLTTSLGVVINDMPEWNSSPIGSLDSYDLPNRSGVIYGSTVVTKPRELKMQMFYRSTSLSDRKSKENLIKSVIGGGLKKIAVSDGSNQTVHTWGVLSAPPVVTMMGHFITGTVFSMTCSFTCPNGFWQEMNWSSLSIAAASTSYQVSLGTYPGPWILNVMGAATGPFTVTVKRSGGQTVSYMTFSGSLTSSEWLSVDSVNRKIEKVSGGSRTSWSGSSNWTAGEWLAIDPVDGNYALSSGPTIEVSSGTAELLYLKRYR